MKTILVTGGAGFVGSHLIEALVKDPENKVISLDNYFTGTKDNHIEGAEYREGHTKDVATHVPEDVDVVFHLGEYARVEKSFEDVAKTWELNIPGTFGVLEFSRHKKCKLVYAGSSTKFADNGVGRNQSPYAWTKASNTDLVRNYGEWFGLDYAITYFYNVYGPREMAGPFGTVIRIFSDLYKQGQPLTVVSPGTQRRNFTHVTDIVQGLLLVGEKGAGDGYGIGAEESYSIQEVADMFGGDIVMMPARQGNRMNSGVDSTKTKALGWNAQEKLDEYISSVKDALGAVEHTTPRVLVFSTTFYPQMGIAEEALLDVMRALPSVQFDVVTTKYSQDWDTQLDLPNVSLHKVGFGRTSDKWLLPILGARKARELASSQVYTFKWSILASYGAVAALLTRKDAHIPTLITLGDQKLWSLPWHMRLALRYILNEADQVYVTDAHQTEYALTLSRRVKLVNSIGEGDAFANQIRVAYVAFLKEHTKQNS